MKRIFPSLVVVMAAFFVLGWFGLFPDEFKQFGKHLAAGAGFIQNFILWKEAGYFDTASELKPLLHLWSLSIEEQFYFFYPLVMWLTWRLRFDVLKVLVMLALVSFYLNIQGINGDLAKVFYLPQTRFWELLAGSLLAYVSVYRSHQIPNSLRQKSSLISVVGLFLIMLSVILLNHTKAFPGWWALGPVAGAWLLIWSGSNAWVNRTILSNRFMVWTGLISYPLYLWHWPLLSFARILESEKLSSVTRCSLIALSFFLAWLTYKLVERPLRFGMTRWPSWVKTATLTAALAGIGGIGYLNFENDGFAFRSITQHEWWQRMQKGEETVKVDINENESIKECSQKYPNFNICHVSSLRPPTILVIGDSHSGNFYNGLVSELAGSGETFLNLGQSGTMPLLDVSTPDFGTKEEIELRRKLVNEEIRFVKETSSVHTVFLIARGPFYLLDKKLSLFDHPEIEDNIKVYETALRKTFQSLNVKNKRTVFVLDQPEIGFAPRSCLSRPLRITSARNPCAVSREEFDKRNWQYREIVTRVSKEFKNVVILDAASPLCDEKWCWAQKEGQVFYVDDNHLSISGAKFVVKSLLQKLNFK